MGSFAILRKPEEPEYNIDECHVNLWSLGGFLNRRVFFFDVGLILSVTKPGGNVNQIHISLPFRTSGVRTEWRDLSEIIKTDQPTAQLVFGRPATIEDDIVTFRKRPPDNVEETVELRLITIRSAILTVDRPKYWTLSLTEPITKANTSDCNQQCYLRVRFVTRNPKRMWLWMNWKTIGIADFRVGDTREVVAREIGAARDILEKWFVPIQKIRVFLIVPCDLLLRGASPAVHYMRMLEGAVWHKYLNRSVTLFRLQKLMIYQWRNDETREINILDKLSDPWKAFVVLSKQSLGFWSTVIVFMLVIALVASINFLLDSGVFTTLFSLSYDFLLVEVNNHVGQHYGKYGLGVAVLLAIYSLARFVLKIRLKSLYYGAKQFVYRLEDVVYYLRGLLPF